MTEDEARQRIIRSMCPQRVCRTCGQPSRRIVEADETYRRTTQLGRSFHPHTRDATAGRGQKQDGNITAVYNTVGWTDCGHDNWREGVWLDPFPLPDEHPVKPP